MRHPTAWQEQRQSAIARPSRANAELAAWLARQACGKRRVPAAGSCTGCWLQHQWHVCPAQACYHPLWATAESEQAVALYHAASTCRPRPTARPCPPPHPEGSFSVLAAPPTPAPPSPSSFRAFASASLCFFECVANRDEKTLILRHTATLAVFLALLSFFPSCLPSAQYVFVCHQACLCLRAP